MAEGELPNPKELEEIKEKASTKRVALITAGPCGHPGICCPGRELHHERDGPGPAAVLRPVSILPCQNNPGAFMPEPEDALRSRSHRTGRVHEARSRSGIDAI